MGCNDSADGPWCARGPAPCWASRARHRRSPVGRRSLGAKAFSAGCALIDPADPSRETLIGRADVGLVMAKRAGRNQVVAA